MESRDPSQPTPESTSSQSPSAAAPQMPQKIVLEQPGGWFGRLGKILLVLLIISASINFTQMAARESYYTSSANVQEKYHSGSQSAADKVAVLELEGVITGDDSFLKKQIDRVREDESVKALVLRVNSPGGTVSGSDYLYHHLKDLVAERELPLVVSMGGVCASGGYYVSMAVGETPDTVFAEPTTATGSIGVVIPHYDLSKLLDEWHIEDDSIVTHPHKLMGSPTRQLTEEEEAEERKLLQEMVDHMFDRFKRIVRSGRPKLAKDDEALDKVTTGRIFIGEQAEELGLVDKIGFVEDAVERAVELAGLKHDEVRVVRYKQTPNFMEALSSSTSARGLQGLGLQELLDLTAPRAYYLSTWLPAVLTNR